MNKKRETLKGFKILIQEILLQGLNLRDSGTIYLRNSKSTIATSTESKVRANEPNLSKTLSPTTGLTIILAANDALTLNN